jgi:hypothetical protein
MNETVIKILLTLALLVLTFYVLPEIVIFFLFSFAYIWIIMGIVDHAYNWYKGK